MKIVRRIVLIILLLAALAAGAWFIFQHINAPALELEDIPEYSGQPAVEINKGRPAFAEDEIKYSFFEEYSKLDRLGRSGIATACLDREHMPAGERGSIGMIKPSGWQIEKYDFIDNGGYLYNRCHIIGWQLTGQNDERNLMTGTRYFNVEGMLPYENQVASYIRLTGEPVMYRVSPIYKGNELLARGVQIEAMSAEDRGVGLSINVFCYNVQPGVEINYRTGDSKLIKN